MYKDKDRQREANRQASQRQRDKKGMTDDCAKVGIVIPDHPVPVIPERTSQGNIRVSKPGDADYVPQCETTRAFVELSTESNHGQDLHKPIDNIELSKNILAKRGKDIKSFEDLPPDVQQTIGMMSMVEGKIDQTIKANRTAIAIHYQHTFPERY